VARAEGRVARMVAVMGGTFTLAWTPYAVLAMVMSFGPKVEIQPAVNAAPAIIAKSSCIYNPIIYVGLNSQVCISLNYTIKNYLNVHQPFQYENLDRYNISNRHASDFEPKDIGSYIR